MADMISKERLKGFVISIESLDESVNIANRCIESGKRYGFKNIERFPAITPKNSDVHALFDEYHIRTDKFLESIRGASRPLNVMGCFLSHYFLWRMSIELNESILILEHDAVFVGDFFVHHSTSDIFDGRNGFLLSLAKPSYGKFNRSSKVGVQKLFSKKALPGATGYIISPSAAEELISHSKVDAKPTDAFISSSTFEWIYEYYPWIVEAHETFTTVQSIEKGLKPKHSYRKNPKSYRIMEV